MQFGHLRKSPRTARVADTVGGILPNRQREKFPRGGTLRELARQQHLRTQLLCPQLCVGQRIPRQRQRIGVQQVDGRAPLFGERVQLVHIRALPIGDGAQNSSE